MKEPEFTILPIHRQGIERAAQWHDRMSKILRGAIAERIKHKMNVYGELLWRAEQHEQSAMFFRDLLKASQTKKEGAIPFADDPRIDLMADELEAFPIIPHGIRRRG